MLLCEWSVIPLSSCSAWLLLPPLFAPLGWLELSRSVLSFLRAALLRYGLLVLAPSSIYQASITAFSAV